MELIVTSIYTANQFASWFLYFVLLVAIVMMILHTHFLQKVLISYEYCEYIHMKFKLTLEDIVIAIYYTSITFLTVSAGVLFFIEWQDASFAQMMFFFVGVLLEFVGVFLLARSHSHSLSIYPIDINDPSKGAMIKLANVDLDEDIEKNDTTDKKEEVSHATDAEEQTEDQKTQEKETTVSESGTEAKKAEVTLDDVTVLKSSI